MDCPDRSSEELAARENMVTDLKKRNEQTHLDHYIRYGKVCSRVKKLHEVNHVSLTLISICVGVF